MMQMTQQATMRIRRWWTVFALVLALSILTGAAATKFTSNPPVLDPAYSGSYQVVDIGPVPVDPDIGAVTFKDANTLYVDVDTFQPTAELDAVTVVRDANGHVSGFSGSPTAVTRTPFIDGGLQTGIDGVYFYTAFPINQLGQFKPGSSSPDATINLKSYGVTSSVGSMSFVPPGFGGEGLLKLISWDAKTWYSAYLNPDGAGTFTPSTFTATALPSINWEGFAFVRAGQPLFPVNSVLMNGDLVQAVYAFELDANGNPKTSTQKHFMDISDPVGMTIDPVTGDILITTEQGPLAKHVAVVKGFSPPNRPSPTVATSAPSYSPGQSVVANFANATGHATDWVGIYAAGAPNTAFLAWFYLDGTRNGTAGITNGSVTFPAGLPSTGAYDVRLFSSNTYALLARKDFTIESAVPSAATFANPATSSTGVNTTPNLTWAASPTATSHMVYFGTNPSPGAGEFKGTQTGTTYLPGALSTQTTYYWRIDEANAHGTTTGQVWSFTTVSTSNVPTIAVNRGAYKPGASIIADFGHASGDSHDWIGLYTAGAANSAFLQWFYTDGTHVGTAGITNGTVSFPDGLTHVGTDEARLFFADTFTLQAAMSFSVTTSGSTTVATGSPSYTRNQSIVVNFTNAPGNAFDWIGLYVAGAPDEDFIDWRYLDGTQNGTPGIVNGTVTFPNGLPSQGDYEVRLYVNNTFTRQASGTFTVTSSH